MRYFAPLKSIVLLIYKYNRLNEYIIGTRYSHGVFAERHPAEVVNLKHLL